MRVWRPHTTGILIGGLVVILLALVGSFMLSHFQSTIEVRLGSGVFNVRIAATDASQQTGLSGVAELGPMEGLLMPFKADANHGIWMKDMLIPLDIIWLDKDKAVVYMVTDASPTLSTDKIFTPIKPARYVLEVAAGSIKSSAIKIGDKAEFTLEGEKK